MTWARWAQSNILITGTGVIKVRFVLEGVLDMYIFRLFCVQNLFEKIKRTPWWFFIQKFRLPLKLCTSWGTEISSTTEKLSTQNYWYFVYPTNSTKVDRNSVLLVDKIDDLSSAHLWCANCFSLIFFFVSSMQLFLNCVIIL